MNKASKNGIKNFGAGLAVAGLLFTAGVGAAHAQQRGDYGYGSSGGFGRQDRDRGGYDTVRDGFFEARLDTDRTNYSPNRGVEIRITLENTSDGGRTLQSGREVYEVQIRDDRTGRLIRDYHSRGSLRLNPGDQRSFREIWDQRDENGRTVPGGTYRIEVKTFGAGRRLSTRIFLAGEGRGNGGLDNGDDRPRFPDDLGGRPGNGRPGRPGRPNWPDRGGDGDSSTDYRSVRADLSADQRRVRPGNRVRFTYTVTNSDRNDSRTFRFSSGRQFEFEVTDGSGRNVWRSSEGMMYPQALTEFTLRPGERRTFTAVWQVPNNVRNGIYEVRAYLPVRGGGSSAALGRTRVEVED